MMYKPGRLNLLVSIVIILLLIIPSGVGARYLPQKIDKASESASFDREVNRPRGEPAASVPGEVLVKMAKGIDFGRARTIADSHGLKTKKEFKLLSKKKGKAYLHLKSEQLSTEELVALLRKDPRIEEVWPNWIRKVDVTFPIDPGFGELWGLDNTGQTVNGYAGTPGADIDAPEAWDTNTGSPSVVVADIDTGVDYTHLDLAANMWINPGEIAGNGIDDDGNGYIDDIYGIDAYNGDSDPMDDHGHGTHTSGTIAASGNDGFGIAGVCWQAKIMALKFLSAYGSGSDADAIECIEYVVDMKQNYGVNVVAINASWGGYGGSDGDLLYDAIDLAGQAGIIFCAAAGNDGLDNDSAQHTPSSYSLPNIIAVAATDQDDELASFSNYGQTTVDLVSPGVNIYSTLPGGSHPYTPAPGDIFFDDMESGSGNWTTGGTNNTWAISSESSYSPSNAWADSPGGNYSNNTDSWLAVSNDIDLSGYVGQNVALGFWAELDVETYFDELYVELSDDGGMSWTTVSELDGHTSWSRYAFSIPDSYKTTQFRFRFWFSTDYSVTYDGVHIDNVGIGTYSGPSGSTNYDWWDGTSMATPHVAGAVALMASEYPGEDVGTRVNRILSGVDPLPSLTGKVATGGRLNIAASIDPGLVFNPLISTLSPSQGLTPGTNFDLTGTDFGASPGRVLFLSSFGPNMRTTQFRFRFRLDTDYIVTYDGVHIDDVQISSSAGTYFSDDMESGSGNWTTGGANNTWAISSESSHSPSNAWTDSPGGNYSNYTDSWLAVNSDIDLSGDQTADLTLGFWAEIKIETGYDNLFIEISPDGGTTWYSLGSLTGSYTGWNYYQYSISGGGEEADIVSWSDTNITAKVPSGTGKFIVVERQDLVRSNPAVGSAWIEDSSTITGRYCATATAYNGKIYLFGGYTDMSHTSSAEVFDPLTGWSSIASMPTSRANLCSAEAEGKIYVINGYNSARLNIVEAYDPDTNSWETKAPSPIYSSFSRAAALNGYIYLSGGLTAGDGSGLFRYDTNSDSWAALSSMSTVRYGHQMVSVNGKLYVFGGNDGSNYLNSCEAYDPATDSWSAISPMPIALARMGSAAAGRYVYLIGGTNTSWWGGQLAVTLIYDTYTDSWVYEPNSLSELITARSTMPAAYLPGGIYAINGLAFGGGTTLDSVEKLGDTDPHAFIEVSANPAACNQEITFDGSGSYHSDSSRTIVSYEWDFDYDGDAFNVDATGISIGHSYPSFGTYTVALRVSDDGDPIKTDIAVMVMDISVGNPPWTDGGGPYFILMGGGLILDGSKSSDPDAGCGDLIISWDWDLNYDGVFGDLSGETISLTWTEVESLICGGSCLTGTPYPIGLRITDSLGYVGYDTTFLTIEANNPPVAAAGGPYNLYVGNDLSLDGSGSYDPDNGYGDSIVQYKWDLDNDGLYNDAVSVGPTISWATLDGIGLSSPGSYQIGLEVEDVFGATGADTATLTVTFETIGSPSVSGPAFGATGVSYSYTATGAASDAGHGLEYEFDWGSGPSGVWGPAVQDHSWEFSRMYTVKARGRCVVHTDRVSGWSAEFSVAMEAINSPSVSGPASGEVGISYSYTATGAVSDAGHNLEYQFDWGDGLSGWGSVTRSHNWVSVGTYAVKVRARCVVHTGAVSNWSTGISVTMTDPAGPERVSTPSISGPASGEAGASYSYTASGAASDAGHDLEYQFDWGDGLSGWGSATQSHSWASAGAYMVKARARCVAHTGVVSDWSTGLSVTVADPGGGATGFDWTGGAEGCGVFEQQIDQSAIVEVGTIPAGLENVSIRMICATDVDIQLYDQATGEKIIGWPDGLLSGSTEESIDYQGMTIVYSGYNGDGTGVGHEYIQIVGTTSRDLVMKAYGYAAGYAIVDYQWGGGSGTFTQAVADEAVVEVGVISPGIRDVFIALTSDSDIDIQLYDVETGEKIIGWPDGLLSGPNQGSIDYHGITVIYSGYNGDGTGLGHESLRIEGVTNRALVMRVYGYAAGEATVDYWWGTVGNFGTFQQQVNVGTEVDAGEIPAGLGGVYIELLCDTDVDVRLYDGATMVVGWNGGLLDSATEASLDYGGMTITYSGYNGDGTGLGHEYIKIDGVTTKPLFMKIYGFVAGDATINYYWGCGGGY